MSEATVQLLSLDALELEDAYANAGRWSHCELGANVEVRRGISVAGYVLPWRVRRTQTEGACRHPAAGVIRIACSADGVARKALCRMHLDRLRSRPGVVVTCPTCRAEATWTS